MTESSKPPAGRRMKAHAPPPPPSVPQPAPRHIFRNTVPDGGGTSGMDTKENLLKPTVELQLTLPDGYQIFAIEDGHKALMDLLVEVCSRYHLNPALHTLELLSPEGHSLGFKPNALLGSINVACALIKEKVWEEKVVRRPAPKVPEKTVRLMVNYHGSQKAVVRVNPVVPLQDLIPVICDKCEFNPSHVLLLKDSISRHELPLDKSLSELGIKELYVHDQSLDSIRSSTASLGRPEKKGFLGIFQFSRRKSKTETTSKDMDDCDDRIIQNTDMQSDALSTSSGVPSIEDQPVTFGQSQSVMNISRMSPKAEVKKRRAPVPPGQTTQSVGHSSFESSQIGLGSESQQRKRKAPAPPPTPTSITQGSDPSTSATATPDSLETETPPPAICSKGVQSANASTVVTQTVKPASFKIVIQPLNVYDGALARGSPTPSSSTAESAPGQDSSSELSQSLDDSDTDLDQTGSHCSTLTNSSASGTVNVQTTLKSSSTEMEGSSSSMTAHLKQEVSSDSTSRSETESAMNLALDEVENNRHSAIGHRDRPVPPKPRRSPAREPPQHVELPSQSSLPSSFSPIKSTESSCPHNPMEVEDAAPQSWLHSTESSAASGQKPLTEAPEDETLSLGSSSSGGSSLPDHGYAASEGMVEGEDSGVVSSPSDTQPTSPDGSLSLDGNSGGQKRVNPLHDGSSDSDEGCATWGSIHRHNGISSQAESVRLKKSHDEDPDLTAQLHQTLAEFDADLAGHVNVVSAKDTPYTRSTDSNEVPVSVVDLDVPVTAIDEVLEEYERNIEDSKSLSKTDSASSRGSDFHRKSSVESQNINNNAYTAAVNTKKSIAKTKQSSQSTTQLEKKSVGEKKVNETKTTKIHIVKDDKQTSAVKFDVDMQKKAKTLPPSQTSESTKKEEEMHKVSQNTASFSTSQGKITRNVTSRFGMKTFTVVPPKPAVVHTATEQPANTLTTGAIKIDDQGNMVTSGISRTKLVGSSEMDEIRAAESSLLGKAKAFWSSNEKQESVVIQSKDQSEKPRETLKAASSSPSETSLKTCTTESLKSIQSAFSKPAEGVWPEEVIKEETKEQVEDIGVAIENQVQVESTISVSKSFQTPMNKPVLPPPLLPDFKRDLSFLKPSRRTSSQYVASAINKYSPKTSAKPSGNPKIPEHSSDFQRSGRSIQVNPHLSSQSVLSDNKENVSIFTSKPPGPKRSMSYPEYVSDSRRDFTEVRRDEVGFKNHVSTKGTSQRLETERDRNDKVHSSESTHIKLTASRDEVDIQQIRCRSPSPARVNYLHASTKPPTAQKIESQVLRSNSKDLTNPSTHLSTHGKPQPSVTVSDSGVTPGPPAVTVFGPIAKFRPVIHKSIEKETSLHSSLMDAIQTGGGRERLKKISTTGPSNLKRGPYVEEENERSALLAAIRAQSISSRLRKTKSEAADELEKFRKAASVEERNAGPSSSSSSPPFPPALTCAPPVFNPPPPPPPPAPMAAPPPPPPVLPQAKPSSVAHPTASNPMNPALAREAMLEAIRSGSAAERLKKVAVPMKTVQVNGRLGTIQATSSIIPQ